MNEERLNKIVDSFVEYLKEADDNQGFDYRTERKEYYQSFDYNKILEMSTDELLEYLTGLWSVMNVSAHKIIDKNGFDNFKHYLAELLYGQGDIKDRFDNIYNNIVEFKTKAITEVLSLNYPDKFMIWDSKVESLFNLIGLNEITSSNTYDYNWYTKLMEYGEIIRKKISDRMGREVDYLDADYIYEYLASKDINYKTLDRILASYKNNFEGYIKNEIYKWEAVDCFQKNWDLEADDFVGMLEKAFEKSGNLLTARHYFQSGMIIAFAKYEKEKTREMFRNLFDESIDLKDRIDNFLNESDEIFDKYWKKPKSHFQDMHSISVYLTFMYPDKYSFYKASIAKKVSKYLGFDINPKDKDIGPYEKKYYLYDNYLKVCDRIMDHIKDDNELYKKAESYDSIITNYYNIIPQDIIYYAATKYTGTKYWLLSPFPGNVNHWNEFLENNIIKIGWTDLGDLTEYNDKDSIGEKLKELYDGDSSQKNNSKALFDFVYEMKEGDYVLIKNGKYNLYGYGKVTSDYIFDGENIREMEWIRTGDFDMTGLAPEGGFPIKTLTDITEYDDGEWAKNMIEKMDGQEEKPEEVKVDESNTNYYFLNAKPKVWSFSSYSVGEIQTYTSYSETNHKRKVYANYESIKVGDKIIVYESTPVKEIVGMAVVVSKEEDNSFSFKKLEQFANTISYDEIRQYDELKNMEFLKIYQGSLFKLTNDEFDFIYELIRENNQQDTKKENKDPYNREMFDEQVFLPIETYDDIVNLLNRKRNVILQGPPGVGKTYLAKKIAYSMMGEIDESRIKVIQFHQSYSYEDFVEGYRPDGDRFKLKKGVFYQFCKQAENDLEKRPHFFIIDEINRGNISKIFGELLVLLEKDKRSNTKINLVYSEPLFTIPDNVYIIGMMNTADRSLAIIDYALRRRFSFVEIKPAFKYPKWKEYQDDINNELFNQIINTIIDINEEISRDQNLTQDCMIGHSYFSDLKTIDKDELHTIIKYEILPLLKEYYIDNITTYDRFESKLEGLFTNE